ncbi:putative RNA-binding protein with PUA-like domain [Novosphingobium chloroacetimidivorans]|uniref:Putative RNA-binding protein with PUA-like domain n=1 Tax=Novosphingobium chloroacetimidivorans TaxID=1428314 RepID=A0A7W7K982_9SPHN|nr:EVE domain-containing protein [Novosphingobium chloroacetimidivorans]MBB4858569.1 putative RNA-binding protein with PUA-like domain [Novosphingobium chloroacetimidivorans]
MSKSHGAKSYWLMKSEPDAYSWDDLVAEGEGTWDGVRNHRAANNLRAMQVGDEAFFYHSNIGKEIVGVVSISESGLADPSDPEGKWAAVKVKPVRKLKRPVTLKEIKADPALADMELVKLSRLSVASVTAKEWAYLLDMADEASNG